MINQPILTIAIPTYNRANYLDLCLERIGVEIDHLNNAQRDLVKVYISDNASTDNTVNVILRYLDIYGERFKVVRNEKNMGMDYNFSQCYESATTPYVWIFGDDDVLLPSGLSKVLDALIKNEFDLLYVNNYWFLNNYEEKPRGNDKHTLSVYQNSMNFARRTNVMLTYLSGLIVRSGIGLNYRSELNSTHLTQLSWVLPLLRDGKSFAIIESWVVAAKGGNTGGYGLIRVFGENLNKITGNILHGKPKEAKVIQNGVIINFFPGFVLELRNGSSKFSEADAELSLKNEFHQNWRYYLFLMPLFKLPLFLAYRYNHMLNLLRRLLGNYLI